MNLKWLKSNWNHTHYHVALEVLILKPDRNLLALLLLLLFLATLKFTFFVYGLSTPGSFHSPDSHTYIETAQALLQTGGYDVSPDSPGIPQFMRTPGYPTFIALVFLISGESEAFLIVLQILLSIGTLVLTYSLARTLFDSKTALVSVLILSLDIPSFLISQKILTETLFTFVLLLTVNIGISALRSRDFLLSKLLFQGILISLATLIRPISYYLIPLLIVYMTLLCKVHFHLKWRSMVLGVMLFTLPCLLLVGGWQLRNHSKGGFSDISYIQGLNLLFYRGAGIIAERDGITLEEAQTKLGHGDYSSLHPETHGWSKGRLARHWKDEGLRLIKQYPLLCLKTQALGFRRMMFIPGMLDLLVDLQWFDGKSGPLGDLGKMVFSDYRRKWFDENLGIFLLTAWAVIVLGMVYLGVFASLCRLIGRGDWLSPYHVYLWLVILYFMVISAGPEAYHRFRIPFMPLLAVYAGQGMMQILSLLSRKNNKAGISSV